MRRRFTDRRVVVTGASSGMGRAAAIAFAREGAAVAVLARNEERLAAVAAEISSEGGDAVAIRCDVTRAEDCEAAVVTAVDRFGGIDVLFNNAGILYRERTVLETTLEEWEHIFAVNVRGTFLMSKATLPVMLAAGGGAIVNNASYYGLVGSRGTVAYNASKGAVVLLTKTMALDHAMQGIRVNCVCPGSVDTPMLRAEMERMGAFDAAMRRLQDKHPMGRIASPEEIAAAVLYLASDDASFVTGVALPVDGGITAA